MRAGDAMVLTTYGRSSGFCVDPIEKKPLLLVEPMKGEGIYELSRQQAEAAAQRSKPQPAQTVPQPGSREWLEAQKKQG